MASSSHRLPRRAPTVKSTRDVLASRKVASKIGAKESDDLDDQAASSQAVTPYVPLTIEAINNRNTHIRRIVHVSVSGTMSEFGERSPHVNLFHHEDAVKYSSSRALPGSPEDFGDPRRGFILDAKVISGSNNFPCPVIWSSEKFPGEDTVSPPDGAVQKGFFVTPAATPAYQPGKREGRIRCRPHVDKDFLHKYAHALPGIEDKGVTEVPGGNWYIPRDNPLNHIILANCRPEDIYRREGPDPVTGKIVVMGMEVSFDILQRAREAYKTNVLPNVPLVDMLKLHLSLNRKGKEWTDPVAGMPAEIFDVEFTAELAIELTYRLMFAHEIPDSTN